MTFSPLRIEATRRQRGGPIGDGSRSQPGEDEALGQAFQPRKPRLFLGMDGIDQDGADARHPAGHHVGENLVADDCRLQRHEWIVFMARRRPQGNGFMAVEMQGVRSRWANCRIRGPRPFETRQRRMPAIRSSSTQAATCGGASW